MIHCKGLAAGRAHLRQGREPDRPPQQAACPDWTPSSLAHTQCRLQGTFCSIPTNCTGALDADGVCCEYELTRAGVCCPYGQLDSKQNCCSGVVDAVGVCGGSAQAIDWQGDACEVSEAEVEGGLGGRSVTLLGATGLCRAVHMSNWQPECLPGRRG